MATLLDTPYQLAYAYASVPSKFQATGDANVSSLAHPLHGRGNQRTKCMDLDFFQEVRYQEVLHVKCWNISSILIFTRKDGSLL